MRLYELKNEDIELQEQKISAIGSSKTLYKIRSVGSNPYRK